MNINLTLLGEMITFAILVWFTMKYIWPPIIKAMREREKKIAEGLEAGERGRKWLEVAEKRTADMLRHTKMDAAKIIENANARANQIVDEAKGRGQKEGQRILDSAQAEIQQQLHTAKSKLTSELADLVVSGAEKILEKDLDKKAHEKMMKDLVKEI